ncbi:hypothetical protein B5807_06918 [Epicoccum nigrum]|uniref:BTB domain-containing protein n=1 Tax=Epicoccum nigrum TaxID=105696 RepID=A0A1Y2M116_EPING|nr:hypothetical protein B5807_06918 [Epicoccum nigrum]
MKLTVVKSQSMKETSYGRVKVVSDVAIGKKLRSPTTTAVSSSLATSPITVVVGPKREKIYVHETILSSSSAYLKNALKLEWQKPGEKEIKLRDVDIASFRTYINWLYTGRFKMTKDPADKPKAKTGDDPAVFDPEWTRWTHCYELVNFLQDNDCKDSLIDMAIEKMMSDTAYVAELPNLIYSTSHSRSPSMKLAVDIAVNVWSGDTIIDADQADYSAEFLVDVVKAGLRRNTGESMGVQAFFMPKDTCVYHEHTLTNTPCYKIKRGFDPTTKYFALRHYDIYLSDRDQ